MKILNMEIGDLDELWNEVMVTYTACSVCYDDMMVELDEGGKIDVAKQRALTDQINNLQHKIEVFRSETDV